MYAGGLVVSDPHSSVYSHPGAALLHELYLYLSTRRPAEAAQEIVDAFAFYADRLHSTLIDITDETAYSLVPYGQRPYQWAYNVLNSVPDSVWTGAQAFVFYSLPPPFNQKAADLIGQVRDSRHDMPHPGQFGEAVADRVKELQEQVGLKRPRPLELPDSEGSSSVGPVPHSSEHKDHRRARCTHLSELKRQRRFVLYPTDHHFKNFDTGSAFVISTTGHVQDFSPFLNVPVGTGSSSRQGQYCVVTSVMVRFYIRPYMNAGVLRYGLIVDQQPENPPKEFSDPSCHYFDWNATSPMLSERDLDSTARYVTLRDGTVVFNNDSNPVTCGYTVVHWKPRNPLKVTFGDDGFPTANLLRFYWLSHIFSGETIRCYVSCRVRYFCHD